MLLKNDGFYMAELLVSLAGWLLIAGIFVPLMMQVKNQTLQIQEKSTAAHILYEYAQTVFVENQARENSVILKDNTSYELIWQEGEREVCIHYEDVFKHSVNLCETVQ